MRKKLPRPKYCPVCVRPLVKVVHHMSTIHKGFNLSKRWCPMCDFIVLLHTRGRDVRLPARRGV